MRVLAFDPGGTTGVALYTENQLQAWQVTELYEVYDILREWRPDEVVFERFVYQRRDKVDLTPVEVIGVIKLFCDQGHRSHDMDWHIEDPHAQTPSQAKNLWTDSKLKKLGLWQPGKPHAMDAVRHMMYFLVVTKGQREWLEGLRPISGS